MVTFRVKDKETKTGVEPAEIGAGIVNSTECLSLHVEPEKRAGHRPQQFDVLRAKEVLLVGINNHDLFFPGDRETDPVHREAGLFDDADNIPHVTATFPALLTPECHRGSPLLDV